MQPSKSYLLHSVIGTFLVVMCLLGLYAVPPFNVGSFHFKRINILSDILKKEEKKPTPNDTVAVIPVVKPVYLDTCKTGITCIEDYSTDTTGMKLFFSALDSSKNHLVRIAWFGDSYIEGDILLDPLRDSLQALYGGSGVGFVPITSEVATFRQTILHTFSNWKTFSMVGERSTDHPLGPAGFSFEPQAGAKVVFKATNRTRLNSLPTTKVYFGNADSAHIVLNEEDTFNLAAKRIHQLVVKSPTKSLEVQAYGKSIDLYGASFEDTKGICVDNFSMRGNSGIGLSFVNEQMYRDFDSIHHYDLVVLSYGLNATSDNAKDYNWYARSMDQTVKMIRRAFPNSSILLIGCSDRASKEDGELETMPNLYELIDVQRKMAADNHICFWNLFEAMGGDSTMVRWVGEKPPLASKDYTHLTFAGGRKVAGIFMGTLLYEREKYERRKKSL